MARTTVEIANEMHKAVQADIVLSALFTSVSTTAVFRLFIYIVAVAINTFEQILDTHSVEMDEIKLNQKTGRLTWYRTMALKFQYGFILITDRDYYDNGNATLEQIEASKVVKYAAVNESEESSAVIIKIAGEVNGVLSPIPQPQKIAFEAYVKEFKIAGVQVRVINFLPDRLYFNMTMYYDPELLTANGMSILNGNYPVNDAINEYMKELPFNGEFVIANFVDKLQQVPGIKIPHVNIIESSWIDTDTSGYGEPTIINVRAIPESGYYMPMGFDTINYLPYVV